MAEITADCFKDKTLDGQLYEILVAIDEMPTTLPNGNGHTHVAADVTDFASAAAAAAPPTTDASALTSGTLDDARLSANVVLTTDARLTDARTPTSHTHVVADVTGAVANVQADSIPINTLRKLTQAEYDAITPDPNTIYFVE